MEGKKLLKELSEAFAVSGNEENLHPIIEEYFKGYTNEFEKGSLNDLICIKRGRGSGPKILIAAHADEIGLIVTDIDDRGFVHFTKVSGIDPKILPAQEVIIHGKEEVYGVIGAKPPHVLTPDEVKKAIKIEDMVIDTGIKREKLLEKIMVGDFITFKRNVLELLNENMTGKAFDNRAGICCIFECAKELKKINHFCDVYFLASTCEETGYMGVKTSTYRVKPDVGIAVDVTFGEGFLKDEYPLECGGGAEITIGPNIDRKLVKRLIKTAEDNNIPYAKAVCPGNTGTDAWDMQVVGEGVPTLLISLPLKYMHTSTELINYRDIITIGKLMARFISDIDDWGDLNA